MDFVKKNLGSIIACLKQSHPLFLKLDSGQSHPAISGMTDVMQSGYHRERKNPKMSYSLMEETANLINRK
jgi:hypothetical protein